MSREMDLVKTDNEVEVHEMENVLLQLSHELGATEWVSRGIPRNVRNRVYPSLRTSITKTVEESIIVKFRVSGMSRAEFLKVVQLFGKRCSCHLHPKFYIKLKNMTTHPNGTERYR